MKRTKKYMASVLASLMLVSSISVNAADISYEDLDISETETTYSSANEDSYEEDSNSENICSHINITYSDNEDGTHNGICDDCNEKVVSEEAHNSESCDKCKGLSDYEEESLKITWYDEDETTVLDTTSFKDGEEEPVFAEEIPTKEKDENYIYKFSEWELQETPLNDDDISYVAVYEKTDIKYGFYVLTHEYYVKDEENNLILEDTVSEEAVKTEADSVVHVDDLEKVLENQEHTYRFKESTEDITIEEDKTSEIIFQYVRDGEYGSYVIKHNFYVEDEDGNVFIKESVTEVPKSAKPDTIVGMEDADVILTDVHKDGYFFTDSSENITIQADDTIEFVMNYMGEEKIKTFKYGSYQVIHEYYCDGNLEDSVTEDVVSDVLVGKNVGVAGADILVEKQLNHDGKEYEFDSAENVTIEKDEIAVLIVKYLRNSKEMTETTESATVTITANSNLENETINENQFTFRLSDGIDTYLASNDAYGNVVFHELTFDKEGIYRYTLTQDNSGEAGIEYDTSEYEIEITVLKDGNSLQTIVKYLRDGFEVDAIEFNNVYDISDGDTIIQNESLD